MIRRARPAGLQPGGGGGTSLDLDTAHHLSRLPRSGRRMLPCRRLRPDARHTARSITSQLSMVACGLGVALVPESATQQPAAGKNESIQFTLVDDSAEIELAAVSLRGLNRLVGGFLDSVRAVLDSSSPGRVPACSTYPG
jgi:DNA-binding transcriptional LysR family regulator